MQSLAVLAAFAATMFATPAEPAPGDPPARAVAFRCDGDQCSGGGANGPSDAALLRECEQVVSVIGPVSRYQSGGRELSARDLAHCNRRATRTPAAD